MTGTRSDGQNGTISPRGERSWSKDAGCSHGATRHERTFACGSMETRMLASGAPLSETVGHLTPTGTTGPPRWMRLNHSTNRVPLRTLCSGPMTESAAEELTKELGDEYERVPELPQHLG